MVPLSAARSALAALLLSALPHAHAQAHAATPLEPSDDAARRNAFGIFNAVHAAMRQWGSSVHHNGMSLFLATVPEGQLFYHGGPETGRPAGPEWLAFELEHAQMFGMSRPGGNGYRRPPGGGHKKPPSTDPDDDSDDDSNDYSDNDDGSDTADLGVWDWHVWSRQHGAHLHRRSLEEPAQKLLGAAADDDDADSNSDSDSDSDNADRPASWPAARGYFHTYRANRPLNLLYIDGMAAGKSSYGCLDTQDYLLLDSDPRLTNHSGWRGMGEFVRSRGLCDLAKAWAWDGGQIDGFVRAEAGFEIIYCDFSERGGLDLAAVQSSPFANETAGLPVFANFEFLRGVAQRYHGQPAGRIHVDWSSMVSAFFYDVNLTNPDASRPELPRLANLARHQLRAIRARVQQVVAARRVGPDRALLDKPAVDWQGVVDLVVTRFSGRLGLLSQISANDSTASPLSTAAADIVPMLLLPYINYTDAHETAARRLDRCTSHYLAGARATQSSWTPEDHSIYAAVQEVARTVCAALFDMQAVLIDKGGEDGESNESSTDSRLRAILVPLMGTLQWTTWRECAPCARPDELCLIAMFPWGSPDDHFHPRCKNKTEADMRLRNNYWMEKP